MTKDESAGTKMGSVGWFSHDQIYQRDEFKDIADLFLEQASSIMDFMSVVRDEIYLTTMWANVGYRPEYCHQNHIHPNSFLSGVLHVSVPPNASGTSFADPRPAARIFEPSYEKLNEMNGGVFLPECKEGDLFIFPSYLPHGVNSSAQSYGKGKNRITISFNVMFKGTINTRTCKLTLK